VGGIRSGWRARGDPGGDRVEMRYSAPGPGRGRPSCGAQEDGDAEGGDPHSPAGAADRAGQIPHREAGDGGGEDIAMVEQVKRAHGGARQGAAEVATRIWS